MKMLDVLIVCEINVDILVSGIHQLPHPGTERLAEDIFLTAGSSGVLTASGLTALGLRVGVCGMVGDDLFGRYMLTYLDEQGIDRAGVVIDSRLPTSASIVLTTSNDRAILTSPGTISAFSFQHISPELLKCACHLHLSSYFLQSALRPDVPSLLAAAHQCGMSTSADTGFDPDEQWQVHDLFQNLDLFLPNQLEACSITGYTKHVDALERLAYIVPTVAMKLGSMGSCAAQGDLRYVAPAFPVKAIDTTGAGDAFNAGFLAAHLSNHSLEECLHYGNACGALTASHLGGSGALSRERVARLLKQRRQ